MKVQLDKDTYILQRKIGEGNFATVYQTQDTKLVAKICYKSNPKAFRGFLVELDALTKVQGEGIVRLQKGGVSQLQGQDVGVLILESLARGSLIDLMIPKYLFKQDHFDDYTRCPKGISPDASSNYKWNCQLGYVHRDVKMENVLLNGTGQFKLVDFGSVTKKKILKLDNSNREDVKEEIEENTTPYYRAPEYIDFYSGLPITEAADVFALGVLMFMFCFQKPPFESGLAAINNHYFIPESHSYSPRLISLMQSLFTVFPKNRPTAKDVLAKIQSGWQLPNRYVTVSNEPIPVPNLNKQFASVDNYYIEKKEVPLGFFDQVKRYLFTLSKKTEAWVIQSTSDDETPPRLQDIRSLIIKAWLKRDKIDKFYQAVQQKIIMSQTDNGRVMMKLAIVLHQYLKKGPPEAMKEQKNKTIPSVWTITRTVTDVYKNKPNKLIYSYYALLVKKLNLCHANRSLFEASYSLSPFLMALERGQFCKPLESKLFDELLTYWGECLQFFTDLLSPTNLWQIQTVIIMQMVDETYSLLAMFLHLWIAVKETLNMADNVDTVKLMEWILSVDNKFETFFVKTRKIFDRCITLPEFQDIAKYMPKLPNEVITYVNQVEQGKTKMEISPARSIHGIKMPVSYQVTVQKLQQELLSMADFDKPPNQNTQNKDFFADFGFLNQSAQQQPYEQPWVDFQSQIQPQNRESVQTEIDPKVLSQIMFQMNNDRICENMSANFAKPETDVFSFAQKQQKQPQFVDLLDVHSEAPPPKPQQPIDLLTFDEQNVLPVDLNFEEDLIPMSYQEPPVKQNALVQSKAPNQHLTPNRQKIHEQILEHAAQLIDGEVDISEFIIQFQELVFHEQIAAGGSGIVFRGAYRNEIVAIKDIDIQEQDEQKMKEYKREIVTLVKVRHHQNLVCLVGITFQGNKLYLVTEYCSGGSLFDLVHRNRETLIDDNTKLKLCLFIANGMAYLHKLGFMHRDLKSLNLLLNEPYGPDSVIKIADFGLARTALDKSEWMTAVVGTFHWMAPEVFRGEQYTNKADVYSFGIVMYEVYSRLIPYLNIANPMQIMKAVVELNQRPDLQFQCHPDIKALMSACWHPDPNQRPTFEKIISILQQL